MKGVLFLLIVILITGCTPRTPSQTTTDGEAAVLTKTETNEDTATQTTIQGQAEAEDEAIAQIIQEPQQINYSIEGVWVWWPVEMATIPGNSGLIERDLSWGRRVFPQEIAIIVDLHGVRPTIETRTSHTISEITSINEFGNRTEIRFAWQGLDIAAIFRFDGNGNMWVELPENQDNRIIISPTGRDRVYRRIDGPGFCDEMDAMQIILQNWQPLERNVFLPHEIAVTEDAPLIIRENGTGIIEFGGNVIEFGGGVVYDERPFGGSVWITTYTKNNLFGLNVSVQYRTSGTASYMHIFNIATREKIVIPFSTNTFVDYMGFMAIENRFILATNQMISTIDDATGERIFTQVGKIYAFDDASGELLWIQTLNNPILGRRRINANADHLIVGDRYRIFGDDGRKESVVQ